jgi:hypothetical protein
MEGLEPMASLEMLDRMDFLAVWDIPVASTVRGLLGFVRHAPNRRAGLPASVPAVDQEV